MKNFLKIRCFLTLVATVAFMSIPVNASQAAVDYLAVVPHSSHISMMATDFRSNQTAAEYDWNAAHYDQVMAGKIGEYRKRNAAIKFYVYALNLTVLQETTADPADSTMVYYKDMQKWYAAHTTYKIEDAFLHDGVVCPTAQTKTAACRIQVSWNVHVRWVINPGDAGLRLYNADRLKRITTNVGGSSYNADGVFFDEHDSGEFSHWKTFSIREYPVWTQYENDMVDLLASERKALGKVIQLNTAEYISAVDQRMILAAGAAHMELANNPLNDQMEARWSFIDTVLQKGALVEMVNAYTWADATAIATLSSGNQSTPQLRFKTTELCSYYMVVPASATKLTLYMANDGWSTPFSQQWLKSVEVDIGHPVTARSMVFQGKDPKGRAARIWSREFDKAVVYMRPKVGWDYNDYSDSTKITVALPSGQKWYPVLSDGTQGSAVTSVTLRNSEGMILIKGGATQSATGIDFSKEFSSRKGRVITLSGDEPLVMDTRTLDGRFSRAMREESITIPDVQVR